MNRKATTLLLSFVGASVVAPILVGVGDVKAQDFIAQPSFFCGTNSETQTPATILRHPRKGDLLFITWVSTMGEWTPDARCNQVTSKLNLNSSRGNLNFLVAGRGNGQSVLCASRNQTSFVENCPNDNILMTFYQDDDPPKFIEEMLKVNTGEKSFAANARYYFYEGTMVNVRQYIAHIPRAGGQRIGTGSGGGRPQQVNCRYNPSCYKK